MHLWESQRQVLGLGTDLGTYSENDCSSVVIRRRHLAVVRLTTGAGKPGVRVSQVGESSQLGQRLQYSINFHRSIHTYTSYINA